jgi:hypothetical protein
MTFWQVFCVAYVAVGAIVGWEGVKIAKREDGYLARGWFRRFQGTSMLFVVGVMLWPILGAVALRMYIQQRRKSVRK